MPNVMVLTRTQLDPMKCGNPTCDCPGPLVLMANCCATGLMEVEYDWATGHLTIRCALCSLRVATIAVAS